MTGESFSASKEKTKYFKIGNPIPWHWFSTSGVGESDVTVHAGSFDAAMKDAGIPNYNMVEYSSLLPSIAERVDVPKNDIHGRRLDCIMAASTVKKGETAVAGLIKGDVYNNRGEHIGGLVAEHSDNFETEDAKKNLRTSLHEMFRIRYPKTYKIRNEEILGLESTTATKKYATAVAVLGFVDYVLPVEGELSLQNVRKLKPFVKHL